MNNTDNTNSINITETEKNEEITDKDLEVELDDIQKVQIQDQINDINNKSKKLVDELIENIGITKFTWKIYIILALFILADGSEMIVISLITSKLGKLWNLTHSEKGLLGSSVFVGFFLGALTSGKFSDLHGRKPVFITGSCLCSVFAILSMFSPNLYVLILFRACFGLGVGISIPAANSLATEITPTKYRTWILNLVGVFYAFGEIYAILCAKSFLDLENGFRVLLGVIAIPSIISCILSIFILESPRYYFGSRQFEKGFDTLTIIIQSSYSNIVITDEMKTRIIEEEKIIEVHTSYSAVCKKQYSLLTVKICIIFFCTAFCFYGLLYILPQIMEKSSSEIKGITKEEADSKMYRGLIFSALAEIPSIIISSVLSNLKCLGRIRSMALGFICASSAAFLSAIFYLNYLNILVPAMKFSLSLPYLIYIYTCEAYPTKIRSTAIGITNSFNRIAGISTPIISQYIFALSHQYPFIMYGCLCFIGFLSAISLPFETLNREID